MEATAARMAARGASGWDTIDTCEPATSLMVEPARSAMRRWVAGGITLSSVPMTAQLGMVLQAVASVPHGVRAGGDRALAGGDEPAVGLGEVLRKGGVHGRGLEERLGVDGALTSPPAAPTFVITTPP